MTQQPGLRERKKLQTRATLWRCAIDLFAEHGFENVTVAQIAAAADVSKMTVFNYFPSKEELVVAPLAEHIGDLARVVHDRCGGESALAAVLRHVLDGLAARDASTGLNDSPSVLKVQRILRSAPALTAHVVAFGHRGVELLAAELAAQTGSPGDDPRAVLVTARAAAAQITGTRDALAAENVRRLLDGEAADDVYPDAVSDARRAFGLLEHGLGGHAVRDQPAAARSESPA